MPRLNLDFRKILRAIANKAQDANVERLLTGSTVSGGTVAAREQGARPTSSRARVRILGVRVKLAELVGKVGIATGAMLRDLTRRGNVKLGRLSFRIVPSAAQLLKWRVFNSGRKGQEPRPVSGMSDALIREAKDGIAREGREQLVAHLNRRVRG